MKTNFNNIYKGKSVLVIGHTGFKGSWLTLWLKELAANVSGYALTPPTDPNLFETLKLEKKIDHTIGDIRDLEKLAGVFERVNPEIVFHLAAQPIVRLSYAEPKLTYETNVIGTVNVFECVRRTKSVRAVVNVTTDKCYENKECDYGYREEDPMGGYDPYSSSKACSEIVTAAYRSSYFNPKDHGRAHNVALATARAGNVIGGGDFALDRLVPDCARALGTSETIITRNPGATRPWQHVLEPISGYLLLAQRMLEEPTRFCQAWNFGPNDESIVTVEEIIKKSIGFWGKGSYKIVPDPKLHEANLLKLDISKARRELSWQPRYTIDAALQKTIEWYREFYNGNLANVYELTLQQIMEY